MKKAEATHNLANSTDSEVIIGIDLGTTNSLVAVADSRGLRCLKDHLGRSLLPSIVRFAEGGITTVGVTAREQAVEFPRDTINSVKRLMGKSIADIRADERYLPYEIIEGENATARIRVQGRIYSPPEISALILARLKQIAESAPRDDGTGGLGVPVRRAVITVPAYFDDTQRQATRDAGRLAGLDVVRIINEPTAAALAYGLRRPRKEAETIAVYDLGGGTFDISILQIVPEEGAAPGEIADSDFFQVLSTAGDTHLGGDDVDILLVQRIEPELARRFGPSFTLTPSLRQVLRQQAEQAKVSLSTQPRAVIRLELPDDAEFEHAITRTEFEALIRPWAQRTLDCCARALADARLAPKDIQRIVMVGGCSRIPLIRTLVAEFFGSTPYTALNPDEVVALGAAVQGSILAGSQRGALLLDVLPLSLGIETMGGAVAKLILRNSTVPAQAREIFTTSVDNQTGIKIHILQGERELVQDCRSLGLFHLSGLPPMPAGIPQVEVTFHVDANGILNVSALERRSGQQAAIQIVPNHGLSREEVERLEREALAHARSDMRAHRLIDLRVNSALDVKWITQRLERLGPAAEQLDAEYRALLTQRLDVLKGFIQRSEVDPSGVDPDAFQRAKEDLDRASIRLHEVAIAQTLRQDL